MFLDIVIISVWLIVGYSKFVIGGEIGLNGEGCDDFFGWEFDFYVVFDGVYVLVYWMCVYVCVGYYNRERRIWDGVGRNIFRLSLFFFKFCL